MGWLRTSTKPSRVRSKTAFELRIMAYAYYFKDYVPSHAFTSMLTVF